MPTDIVQVDAFTQTPFAGNAAAVCVLTYPADATWMQHVAREMNLAETAFVVPRGVEETASDKTVLDKTGADGYELRWFTPVAEVDLCGHATLASAHVLWQDGHLPHDTEARFHTRSGWLGARRTSDGAIALDFPAEPASEAEPPAGMLAALGLESSEDAAPRFVGRNRMDWLVEVADEATVLACAPHMAALAKFDTRGVIVTATPGTEGTDVVSRGVGHDFVSRFFAPAFGVDEDPVTGSAHCCLGPYWGAKLGKEQVRGYQASDRGGTVAVALRGDRVELVGHAVTVLRGQLLA